VSQEVAYIVERSIKKLTNLSTITINHVIVDEHKRGARLANI